MVVFKKGKGGEKVLEIRFHGRGGQGAVTSAELFAQAAIMEGKYAQAFPSFGPERRGAPVVAFCRIDDQPIFLRTNINEPDIVMVLDPSLLSVVDVTSGLKDHGILIINSEKEPRHFMLDKLDKAATINATQIALDILKRPITNTVLLGALARISAVVKIESIITAIEQRFDAKNAARNVQALQKAFAETLILNKSDCKPEELNSFTGLADIAASTAVDDAPKADSEYLWSELEPGCVVTTAGNAKTFRTGDWRSFLPVLKKERCIQCGVCWVFCPDMAYQQDREGFYIVDLDYCKGCGICAQECPVGAIHMEMEKEADVV
jgi:2-oxoacid:acceptor oxidoreductase gamma subunit (pyruvate/2-ketoisovalerate family)/2-oxoacid:acceptor oxidoreductase delta subunit (pyruvate/2-ketoisovalerate family)